jgi:hypothetical protein
MHLDLTDEEMATLLKELDGLIDVVSGNPSTPVVRRPVASLQRQILEVRQYLPSNFPPPKP